ncbi:hypothetical protein [Trichocoleus sp. FACHB-591]|nr:hypothetical protein [Trichocoleus sp. FACHB-591]
MSQDILISLKAPEPVSGLSDAMTELVRQGSRQKGYYSNPNLID